MLEEVVNWREWIPTGSHAIRIGYEIMLNDGSVLSVYMIKKSKRFILGKNCDTMFNIGHIFLWTLISDHGD